MAITPAMAQLSGFDDQPKDRDEQIVPAGVPCNCCLALGEPFCDCENCVDIICPIDPFCCDVEWDALCADEAESLCTCCPGQDPGVCNPSGAGEGEACGTVLGIVCAPGLYCDFPPGFCISADIAGTCLPLPCPPDGEPVCGCDGVTYPNSCVAHQEGSNPYNGAGYVDYVGECSAVPATSTLSRAALLLLLLAVSSQVSRAARLG